MNAAKVGIPRALFYYRYYPFWKTFFKELDVQILVSDQTNKRMLDEGSKACIDGACLPVKIFYGHVISIKDKVDYLFIPRFTSVSKNEYICPKFGGIPDMIRHTIKGLPRIIDTEVNLRKSKKSALKAAYEVGSIFTGNKSQVRRAYKMALRDYEESRLKLRKSLSISDDIVSKPNGVDRIRIRNLNIAVIAHTYNFFDKYINMDMQSKLIQEGATVITVDMVEDRIIDAYTKMLPKKLFWDFGRRAVGSSLYFLDRGDIDGMIYLMSFGCGVDSFISDLIERRIRREKDIPFIILTLDEHSGVAGMNTRIEAFMDMIRWRCKYENNISAYG
ncbi:MAG: hypothetical protein GX992_03895 [Clostridium sp.]|nr:hypothetical protein [Clostridium sp.]